MNTLGTKRPTVTINDLRKRFGEIERSLPYIDHVTITKNGKPFARISPLSSKRNTQHSAADRFSKYFGIWKDTDMDSDKFWKDILARKSRKKTVKW